MRMVLDYRRKDAFDLLGLDEGTQGAAIHKRFLEYAERFAPWGFGKGLADKARDVFLAGARAYGVLCDSAQREALIERRETIRRRPTGEAEASPDEFRIRTKLLDPAVQFKKAMALVRTNDLQQALVQLEYAVDLDPQNAIYRAELAFTRFLHSPTTGGQRALNDLKETMRIDPKCGLAKFYTGELLRRQGRYDQAEEWLKASIKLMAPDRRPIDALHTLRTQKQRKR